MTAPVTVTPDSHLDNALARIESASIRAWVQANRAAWLQITAGGLAKGGASADPCRLATFIVCTAIGA